MIYLVEDDANIRQLVVYTLCKSGFEAEGFGEAEEFWHAMRRHTPELVMLDIMLPGEDGLSILRRLRTEPIGSNVPVMMLTARDSEYDKVVGLDMGADDYISKPFGMMELLARVRALLRRSGSAGDREYSIGELSLNHSEHSVKVCGKEVQLTLKEFELLTLLLRNRGKVMTRDVLLERVWGYNDSGENRTVDVHVSTLRQKLGEAGRYIATVRGVGYKFEG